MVALGGVCGCSREVCMVALRGACVVAPGGACMVALGGMHSCSGGACVVALGGHAWLLWGGMHGCFQGGCAWDMTRYGDTINERAVRILLECILVSFYYTSI